MKEISQCARRVQNPNRKEFSSEHFPPVHAAALFNNASAIKHLVKELNFRPDALWTWNDRNLTPAHAAVQEKSIDAFKALLKIKPDLAFRTNGPNGVCTAMSWINHINDQKVKEEFLRAIEENIKSEIWEYCFGSYVNQ